MEYSGNLETRSDTQGHDRLHRLRAVVLLAGSVRPSQLRRATGRTLLDLPVTSDRSVLNRWCDELAAVTEAHDLSNLPVRVMFDHAEPMPHTLETHRCVELRIEKDPYDFRGTGGLLCDLVREYEDDDYILVANASQVLLEPVVDVVNDLFSINADVAMICMHDGTPSDFMLMRCGALRMINRIGYVDLKEQAMPAIAERYDVRVVRRSSACGMPIRTLGNYLDALRVYYRREREEPKDNDPIEDWRVTFGLVESDARVHGSAVVHDSVVLGGATVEAGAVVVRSLVCDGAVVGRGESAVDTIVMPSGGGKGKGKAWSSLEA